MKVLGIVAEYNPFHNGHKYHIETAKAELSAQATVVVMSGDFVQRGEPAIFDKFERTKYALLGGADLVIELPAYFALKSAEGFAKGAVSILDATGIVDFLSFGSESGDIKKLKKAESIIYREDDDFKRVLGEKLKNGASFASARESAVREINEDVADILKKPNNILAVEYLKALEKSRIKPHTLKRKGSYNSEAINVKYASAAAVRAALFGGADVSRHLPYIPDGCKTTRIEDFEELILYSLIMEKSAPPDSGDGLWERILKADKKSLEALLDTAKTRRHTMSRVKRALINHMLDNHLPEKLSPSYIRVLGMNSRGMELLNTMKKKARLPVIIKPSRYKDADEIWQLENRASDIYSMVSGEKLGRNIMTSPIIIK